ncbi:PREDICTED: uncharacterized protein LOC104809831 [Tarenaya hassleriana]|uniref:uncharacterized protein LOC104809831 n=1 Tax=Tarenaya hassleriana TaxID=28532 RepID=UPI00053C36E1|nr:PREDICTED: uncharacterized protein LOC104809831 [Tarenaya hassleriana]XP_010534214.1 PREDICTED: uncharacterized protein LOC104809831 [Tarenaya hassleriana]XP_010534215.1 PREDICTED: uncharacterized protein LOC104809831 [Tarenaya hassleriana]XP_019057710.1 PREDICTED: uncharacterized protein LOC104809831 [Tarenaya hassleriana]
MSSKTRNMLEGLVKDSSLKWLLGKRSSFDEEIEEMGRSPSAGANWIPELSPLANVVVRRCSKILGISSRDLHESFKQDAPESLKHPSRFARNFLEYCCFRALALSVQVVGHLSDKKFRRLTFNMMVAWEFPAAASQSLLSVDDDATVSLEAFSRIAQAVPIIADVIICENLFDVLTSSAGSRLQFSVYDKYLNGLERAIKKMKNHSESSLLSNIRSKGEKILEVDGTVTTQPVLEHVGISTWPGRLILTDHALYFEALRVVSYDKPKQYDLSEDLKQVVKPELTGPWGTRLFDKAVSYKSISLSEPVVMEFPELKGHTRRDYWLAIIREVLYTHRYINKFKITGVAREEALSKAVLCVLRAQTIQELGFTNPACFENLLLFNLCDQLPGGDLILETLAKMSNSRELDRTNRTEDGGTSYTMSASDVVSQLGSVFGTTSPRSRTGERSSLMVGEVAVGEMSPLERVVKESRKNYEKVVMAQETVHGVKVDGIDTNMAVMKELLLPVMEVGNWFLSLAYWDDPFKSFVFCIISTFIICRGWIGYVMAAGFLFFAVFMVLTRCFGREKGEMGLMVVAPPPMSTMEQLLAVQNAISQLEQLIQDGNIVLLKFRALLLSLFPQASEKFAVAMVIMAVSMAFVPCKYLFLLVFLEAFTRYSPVRRASTERLMRRLREWWFSIPAAPVVIEREKEEDKKRK